MTTVVLDRLLELVDDSPQPLASPRVAWMRFGQRTSLIREKRPRRCEVVLGPLRRIQEALEPLVVEVVRHSAIRPAGGGARMHAPRALAARRSRSGPARRLRAARLRRRSSVWLPECLRPRASRS